MFINGVNVSRTAQGLGALSVTVLVLAGCGGDAATSSGGRGDSEEGDLTPVSLQLNFTPNGLDSYLYYGEEQGFFADEGVDLEIVPGRNAQSAVDAVATGNVDMARTAGTNIVLSAAQDQATLVVGAFTERNSFGFLLPEDIGGDGIEALTGKQVLTISGGPNNLLAPVVLEKAGVDPTQVELVDVNPAALLSTFAGGEGDALLTAVPFGQAVVSATRPVEPVLFADYGANIPDYSYVVSPDFYERNKELVAGMLRALYRSYEATRADPQAAAEAMAAVEPTVAADETTVGQFKAFEQYRCNSADQESYGPADAEQWQAAVDIFVEAGLLTESFDASTLYTNELFESGDVEASPC